MPFCYYVVHWKVNCLKLAVKPKLPEFQLIRKKYIKRKAKQLNGTKGGVSKNNEEKEFTMKITFSTFLPWISFQCVSDFHAGVRRGLFLGTIQLVGTYMMYHIILNESSMKLYHFGFQLSHWYAPTVHDVSYPSAWNTELCMYFQDNIGPYSMELYDAPYPSDMILYETGVKLYSFGMELSHSTIFFRNYIKRF